MIDGVVNLRDLGGLPAMDGTAVRPGLVYRSGHLGQLATEPDAPAGEHGPTEPDHEQFTATGIRTVFDLRTIDEVTRSPDRVPAHVEVVHLDVLADATESIAAQLEEIVADPTAAERVLAGDVIHRYYQRSYRRLVLLDSARKSYRTLFMELVDAKEPVLFHCTAGKDRTGWAAASLLTLLGVDRDTVMGDFLRSNEPVLESFRPYLQQFGEMGVDTKLLEPVFLVDASYLRTAFDTVEEEFGTIEGYFSEALGVDADHQGALKERLLGARGGT